MIDPVPGYVQVDGAFPRALNREGGNVAVRYVRSGDLRRIRLKKRPTLMGRPFFCVRQLLSTTARVIRQPDRFLVRRRDIRPGRRLANMIDCLLLLLPHLGKALLEVIKFQFQRFG